MAAERAELVPYIQYPDDVPLRQWAALNRNKAWTAIHLVQNGVTIEANARHCPAVMALLGALGPAGHHAARAQCDVLPARAGRAYPAAYRRRQYPPGLPSAADRARGLLVPRRRRDAATGRPGKAWIFDDTIEHEAMNPTDALRVILIVDTWHPDLSPAERAAVAAVMAATDPADARRGCERRRRRPAACWPRRSRAMPIAVFRAVVFADRAGLEAEALPLARAGADASHPRDARMWQVLGLAPSPARRSGAAVAALGQGGGARAGRAAHRPQPCPRDAWRPACRRSTCSSGRGRSRRTTPRSCSAGSPPCSPKAGSRRRSPGSRRTGASSGLDRRAMAPSRGCAGCAASARPSRQLRAGARGGAARSPLWRELVDTFMHAGATMTRRWP